jgi:hypothetical protein
MRRSVSGPLGGIMHESYLVLIDESIRSQIAKDGTFRSLEGFHRAFDFAAELGKHAAKGQEYFPPDWVTPRRHRALYRILMPTRPDGCELRKALKSARRIETKLSLNRTGAIGQWRIIFQLCCYHAQNQVFYKLEFEIPLSRDAVENIWEAVM